MTENNNENDNKGKKVQTQSLINQSNAHFFKTSAGELYASFHTGQRLETWPIDSSKFSSYVQQLYYKTYQEPLPPQCLEKFLNLCRAKADFDGTLEEVYIRIAPIEGGLELDLNTPNGDCVRITAAGWEITQPTRRFYRPDGSLSLPPPIKYGNLGKIWSYLNVAPDDRPLVLGWILAAFKPTGSYPLLIIQGEQNCAKSTTMSNIKALIDPSRADRAGMAKEEREVFIQAKNNWVMSFDNLQAISAGLSDAFCRIATGGAFKQRKLFTNGEEFTIEAARPVLLNGIEDIASRPDLESRAIILHLPRLKERKSEETMKKQFEADTPEILGALMDALVESVKSMGMQYTHPKIRFPASLAWVRLAEKTLGYPYGTFEAAWVRNQEEAKLQNVDLDPVATAILTFMGTLDESEWKGSVSALMKNLEENLQWARKPRGWPETPRAFSGHLSRIADNLAGAGVEYNKLPRQGQIRGIMLTKVGSPPLLEDETETLGNPMATAFDLEEIVD